MQEHESIAYFDFNKAILEEFEISRSEIHLTVKDFAVLGGFQDYDRYTTFSKCILIYKNVTYSKRMISEYVDKTHQQFRKRYEIVDSNFANTDKTMYIHFLDLVSNKIHAYISWEIVASEVQINN